MIEHLLTVAQHPDLPWEHRERISTVVVWLTDQLSEQK